MQAPGTARGPSSDLADLYMFKTQRNKVALVMNVNGLMQSQAGPNYNPLNNDHVYQFHIDNDEDAKEDITFQFVAGSRLINGGRGLELNVQGRKVSARCGCVLLDRSTCCVCCVRARRCRYHLRTLAR